jgi:hypothetical protein
MRRFRLNCVPKCTASIPDRGGQAGYADDEGELQKQPAKGERGTKNSLQHSTGRAAAHNIPRRRCRGRSQKSAGVASAATRDTQTLTGRFGRGSRRVSYQAIHENKLTHFILERRSQGLAGLRTTQHGIKNETGAGLQ